MKFLLTFSASLLLVGSLTGCCYQHGYCDPCTGTQYGGYWTPTCGGPLDPLGMGCRSYGRGYGQCVEPANSCCGECQNGECCDQGQCCNTSTGCGSYYQTPTQELQKVTPANPEPAPPELPRSNGEDKSASGMRPVPQVKQPARRLQEARQTYGVPATFN